jgi:peptidoglycan/LPS O-acetylase OafA/YrhL
MVEIKSHTALRGIAAVLVVVLHFSQTLRPIFDIDRYTSFIAKGYLWVDFFFILSGYILCHVYATRPGESLAETRRFLNARFARIYPLHLATLLFLVALQGSIVLILGRAFQIGQWSTFWLNLLDIHAWGFLSEYDWNFPSWSISAEFAAYLIFPAICLGLRRKAALTCFMLACTIVAGIAFAALIGHNNWERLVLLKCVPMFCLGIALYQTRSIALVTSAIALSAIQLISCAAIFFSCTADGTMHFSSSPLHF